MEVQGSAGYRRLGSTREEGISSDIGLEFWGGDFDLNLLITECMDLSA